MVIKRLIAEEFCDSVRDGTHGTPKPVEAGYKLITGKHIKGGVVIPGDAYNISESDYLEINKRSKVNRWDVLMSMIGTVGELALVKDEPDYAIKNIALFKCGQEVKARWLFYYFSSPEGKGQLKSGQVGGAQQFLSLNKIRNLQIPVPETATMQKIVSILSAYDSLIENNRRQIKLLEEAAQRLYKEWFVDLRFPGHEHTPITNGIPQGWSWVTYGEVIDFNPKVQLRKNKSYLKVPMNALSTGAAVVDMSVCECAAVKGGAKFENGDTLFARITPCLENGKTGLWNSETYPQAVGSTEFIVMRSRRLNPYMVYSIARTESFRQMAQGTFVGADGRQRAQSDKMKEAPYLCPEKTLIQKHANVVAPMMQRVFLLNNQNKILSEARDRLLPKLMSGEVEV